jgi:hypothetical protein
MIVMTISNSTRVNPHCGARGRELVGSETMAKSAARHASHSGSAIPWTMRLEASEVPVKMRKNPLPETSRSTRTLYAATNADLTLAESAVYVRW